jgi:hypothetical protein
MNVAVIASADTPWLGRWRTLPGMEACEAEGRVWVRGPGEASWDLLPALARYTADQAGRLTPVGHRLPTGRLPTATWQPLLEFLRVRPAAAALPALHLAPIAWSLVPSARFHVPQMFVLPFTEFFQWGITAPAVRLKGLSFAAAADGRCCVVGAPLPQIRAESWCVEDQVATPAGWTLPPGITAALVAGSMRLSSGETALLHPDGTAERLPRQAFVDASRSALRATAEGFHQPLNLGE